MAIGIDPTVQRRRLRAELKKARLDANLTQRDVAKAMDWSSSKLIRIESGSVGISTNDLRALLGYYGIKDRRRIDDLVEVARGGKGQSWSDFKNVHSQPQLNYFGFEASARIVRQWEPLVVPGTLQIEEYALAIIAGIGESAGDAARIWEARERRQEVHEREKPPEMFYLIGEAAIRTRVGGANVMRRQLEQLKTWAAAPHVTLRVVPFTAGAHFGVKGPFVHLEFPDPDDDDVVHLENAAGDVTTRDNPDQTDRYLNGFFSLEDIALSPDESLDLLDHVIGEMSGSATTPRLEPPVSPEVRTSSEPAASRGRP